MIEEEKQKLLEKFYLEEPQGELSVPHWPTLRKDHAVLIELIDKYQVETIFEIGAWEGYSSALMLRCPTVKLVRALDICKEMGDFPNIDNPTHPISEKKRYGKYAKKYVKKHKKKKFEMVFCDSQKYEVKDEQYDLVFIDGDHSYGYVQSDTALALKLKPKVIVWHDSNNENVGRFLAELKNPDVKSYEDSIMVSLEMKK